MTLSTEHYEILFATFCASRAEGVGVVVEPHAVPIAHELAEQGWLQRYFADGEMRWKWTAEAETALDVNALTSAYAGSPGAMN